MTTRPRDCIIAHFAGAPPETLGVAVSGGGDSVALLVALSQWDEGPRLRVATVDHGLRAEAAEEIGAVAALCARRGVAHHVLHWQWDGTGNLMASAREARYRLLADWAGAQGLRDVALGHTRDDVAETFVMRLARGAGLDGLSAMRSRMIRGNVIFHRPLLAMARDDLRASLRAEGIGWAEDPTNADTRYDRARIRQALDALGLDTGQVARTAARLAEAREALGQCAETAARPLLRFEVGDPVIDHAGWLSLPQEIRRRILRAALHHVAGAGYGPRGAEMERLLDTVANARDTTLAGCRILCRQSAIHVMREAAALTGLRAPPEAVWDGRWQLERTAGARMQDTPSHIAALGEAGLAHCPDRKATGHPAARLIASPALWRGARLIAAPLAGLNAGWAARPLRPDGDFFALLRDG